MHQHHRLSSAVALHYRRVRSHFLCLVGRPETADDLVQEVFARLCRAFSNGHPIQDEAAFVAGLARNTFREHVRKQKRCPVSLESEEIAPASTCQEPLEVVENCERDREIRRLIQNLDPEEAWLVVGRHVLGLTGQQLADCMNLPRRTALDRYFHAIERLRQQAVSSGLDL